MRMKKVWLFAIAIVLALSVGAVAVGCSGGAQYKVLFDSDGGSVVAEQVVENGGLATKPDDPTKVGYTFGGWTAGGEAYDFDTAVTGDITLKATWTANTDTAYKVEHYQQNIADDEYTLVTADTENKTGTTATLTAAGAKTYTGFTAKAFEQATIAGDGTTVIKIYYDRNTYTVTVDENGGEDIADVTDVKYGATITAPSVVRAGYTFGGWTAGDAAYDFATAITGDITLKATWTANTDTAYRVEHYQQNLADDEYTLVTEDTEDKTGTTDTLTAAGAKTYTGFTAKAFEQATIAGDGTTVIKIYYDRNTYTVTVDENGGDEVDDFIGVKYGATITAPSIGRTGYTFLGWDYDFTTPITSDITVTAHWGVISLNETGKTFTKAGTLQLTAEASRTDNGSADLVWESSNNDVATVSNTGLVTAVGTGEATVTAKFADGKVSATCAISCVDPYKNTSTGVHTYDFATGNVTITGKSGNENNDGANYLIDNMAANFAVDFTISGVSFDHDNDNFVFRLVSTHGRGTSMNLHWWNTRGSIKTAANLTEDNSWKENRLDPGTSLSQTTRYVNTNVGDVRKDTYKVHFERYIDTEAATVTYTWIITNSSGVSTMKVFADTLSENYHNTAAQTKGVGFSVWSAGGEKTDSYTISDFVYTPNYSVTSKLALSNLALDFTKYGDMTLTTAESTDSLVWASSDESVATVDNGKVTAKKVGLANVTLKTADGTVVAACNVECRNPYVTVNQGSVKYDLATGEAFITGTHGGNNNDVAYFNLNGANNKLPDNFVAEFYAKSTLANDQNYTIKVMSSKSRYGTAMNYNWFGAQADYWVAGNWGGERNDPGIANNASTDYVKVRLERSVDRKTDKIAYKITIWTADESNSKVIEFSDVLNDNSSPEYTYAVGFGVKHTGGDGKGIYVKDFTFRAL